MLDKRTQLAEDKHYLSIPAPLFKHICTLDLTRAQQNVFMFHWCQGRLNGNWRSQLAISVVASELCLSESTVKRAYTELEAFGLVRRHGQGRSPADPMRKAFTVTEVTLPDDLMEELLRAPNRMSKAGGNRKASSLLSTSSRQQPGEIHEIGGHSNKNINGKERTPKIKKDRPVMDSQPRYVTENRASSLLSDLRQIVSSAKAEIYWAQIIWTVLEGRYKTLNVSHALNKALSDVREKRWRSPEDMPNDWQCIAHNGAYRGSTMPHSVRASLTPSEGAQVSYI